MDIFDTAKRSDLMSRIRSCGTRPEEQLHALVKVIAGRRKIIRNERSLFGCPDIFIPSLRLAIFLDGCFFHCCPVHGHQPKSNASYWAPKLKRNQDRAVAVNARLRRQGISVLRIWEHEVSRKQMILTAAKIEYRIKRRRRELK